MPGPLGTPLLDNFNRANGAPGANWLENIAPSYPSLAIVSNQLGPGAAFLSNYWAMLMPIDQEAWVTVKALPSAGVQSFLMGRIQNPNTANWSGYQFTIEADGLACYIEKVLPGATTFLQNLGVAIAVNDVIALTCQGSSIKAWKNGSQIGTTQIDTSIPNEGYIGVRHNNTTAPAWDDFGGGSLAPLHLDYSQFPKPKLRSAAPVRW